MMYFHSVLVSIPFGFVAALQLILAMLTLLVNGTNDINCNDFTGCTDCALRIDCEWCESSSTCFNSLLNSDFSICDMDDVCSEGPACTDEEYVTFIGFNNNEELTYDIQIEECNTDWQDIGSELEEIINIDYFENLPFLGDLTEEENLLDLEISCQIQNGETKFWTLASDKDEINYHLLAKLISYSTDNTNKHTNTSDGFNITANDTVNWPPCEIYVEYGIVTQITCVNGTNSSVHRTKNTYEKLYQKLQSDMILLTLHYLLPRTDTNLYCQSQSECEENKQLLITDSEPNGDMKPCRTYDNQTNTTYGEISTVESIIFAFGIYFLLIIMQFNLFVFTHDHCYRRGCKIMTIARDMYRVITKIHLILGNAGQIHMYLVYMKLLKLMIQVLM